MKNNVKHFLTVLEDILKASSKDNL